MSDPRHLGDLLERRDDDVGSSVLGAKDGRRGKVTWSGVLPEESSVMAGALDTEQILRGLGITAPVFGRGEAVARRGGRLHAALSVSRRDER